jgi:hypothetical protein
MIEAYIVRDPEGRVIGICLDNYISALDDAYAGERISTTAYCALGKRYEDEGAGEYCGYTIKREQVAL